MNIDLADTKYNKPISNGAKKPVDLLKILLIVGLIGVLGWIGFLFYQKTILEKDNALAVTSIESTTKRIKELTNSDNPAKKIAVSKKLKKVEDERIIWSKIMAKIIKLEMPGISFQDFVSTPEGEITAMISAKSFDSIQQFISKLNGNEEVDNIVIKSIQLDESPAARGLKVDLSFFLNI